MTLNVIAILENTLVTIVMLVLPPQKCQGLYHIHVTVQLGEWTKNQLN